MSVESPETQLLCFLDLSRETLIKREQVHHVSTVAQNGQNKHLTLEAGLSLIPRGIQLVGVTKSSTLDLKCVYTSLRVR